MSGSRNGLSRLESGRLGLARFGVRSSEDLTRGLEYATRVTAQTLEVARVGVWLWSADRDELRCTCLFDASAGRHSSGSVLQAQSFPAYTAALLSRRVIAATEARAAPETCELTDVYLVPNNIMSLLDAPLYRRGELVGVVCHEHVGTSRTWTDRERDFAASVADLVAVLFEQAAELELESALADQASRAAKADKLDALARFGAGLAHDFNNVLAAILLRADLIRPKVSDSSELVDDLDALVASAQLGARLVRQLLTFAKAEVLRPMQVRIDRVVRQLRPALDPMLGRGCKLETQLPEEAVVVYADYTHLEQVVLNLVINARDAGAHNIVVRVVATNDLAILEVSDDGRGMDEATRERIFEPFFTTNGPGRGLGLPTVASIVQQHHGTISVASQPGRGATFTVRLPRA